MHSGFGMNGDHIGAGIDKCGNVPVRIGNHQVNVQWEPRYFPDGFQDYRANGDIGYEMTVHHIDMQQLSTCVFDLADVITQCCKICGKYGWGDANIHWLTSNRIVSFFEMRYPAWGF